MSVIRVLLIENDSTYAKLLERMLDFSPVGFHVTVVDRLTAALSELYKGRFNLILTDLNLPDIRGLDTIEAIRSTEPALPIIVLTALEDADLEQQAISCGAQLCLRKSEIDTKKLLDAMHQAVRISRQTPPPIKDRHVDRLLTELEVNIAAVNNALAILDNKLRDAQQQGAVHTIRSHIGSMQANIGSYRRRNR